MSSVFKVAFGEGLQPDPDLTVAEWSNQYRIISGKGAAEPGPYRIERTPYLKKIAECLSPTSPYQEVIFMKSAQVGASELGFNWIGYIMHMCPGPILMVQPDLGLAEKISIQRIAPMIDATPVLRDLVPKKSRDSSNQKLLKEFRGGILIIAGANSGASLRSMPIRFLFMDELSAYPADCGEGDPASLAEKRTQTFSARKKIFKNSTPLIKDTCRIEMEFLASDQQRYFVPCPFCGGLQHLQFKNLVWERDRPETAKYKCEHCSELIEEYHKTRMLEAGDWIATASCSSRKIGFHINALYSPLGWFSWADIATDHIKSHRDPALLQQFVNQVLGETFEPESGAKLGASDLEARAEDFEDVAPAGVLLAVGSVDIQDNRFEITRWGFGREEESWVLDHEVIHGNPALPEIWKQLEISLARPVAHATHAPLKLAAVAVDSGGHFTHEAYNFCRHHRAKNWFAVKGSSIRNSPAIGKPKKLDINLKGQKLKKGAELTMVGTDTIKSVIYARLKLNEPGPGYIHFSQDLSSEFYEQLTSEKQITKYVRGFPIKEWTKKSGQRNEALDLAVYAYAALQRVMSRYNRKTFWDQMQKALVPKSETVPNNTQVEKNSVKNARIGPQKRTGFVSRY